MMKNKKFLLIAFFVIYSTILFLYFLRVYFDIYLKTGYFPISKDDFIQPLKSALNIMAILFVVKNFSPSKEQKEDLLKKINDNLDK